MASLQEIRAKLKAAEQRNTENRSASADTSYAFWNLKDNTDSVIRFLPDGNTDNTFFWVERSMIRLPFAGIKGESSTKEITVQVPCVEMYNDGGVCPILSEVRAWWKDNSLEDMARKYWKKRSYIFQGFVVEDGLGETEKPENPIRKFIISPQVFQLIRAALVDPELEDLPTDYIHGLDFRIKKTSKGGFADYSTSTWSRRERPLSDAEQDAIKQHGLVDLSTYLPKRPTEVELKVIKEMFEASVDGEPYDPERWGSYYKPYGLEVTTKQQTGVRPTQFHKAETTDTGADIPFDTAGDSFEADVATAEASVAPAAEPVTEGGNSKAEAILAMIRNRQKQ